MKPFFAALTGTPVAYIVIALIVVRLIAGRLMRTSWIPLFDGVVSILLGALSLGFLNPAGVPVVGLAFAAVGFVGESREGRRRFIFILLAVGAVLCGYATSISLSQVGHD